MEAEITRTFQEFSDKHNFQYDSKPLPFRPYGMVKWKLEDANISIYVNSAQQHATPFVARHPSRVSTVIDISKTGLLPKGFCIRYSIKPYDFDKPFKKQIMKLSYDNAVHKKTLNKQLESILIKAFFEIGLIDRSMVGVDCWSTGATTEPFIRIKDDGIDLVFNKLLIAPQELNKVLSIVNDKLIPLLNELKGFRPL